MLLPGPRHRHHQAADFPHFLEDCLKAWHSFPGGWELDALLEFLKFYKLQIQPSATFTARTADEIDDGGEKISSTAVREAIQAGDVTRARLLMDRPFIVEGVVRRGDQRGRVLGFPTANIAFEDYVRPLPGVYAVRARLPGETQWRAGVANAGKRPTVGGTDERLEVNIFDFEGDLYGLELEVALEAFIRAEKRFDGLDALKAQIGADCETARQILNG